MAQAGTTIGQQQATGFGRHMGLWLALIAAVALAIGLAVAATQINIGASSATSVDRSYDQVEQVRGGVVLPAADDSYTTVEGRRGGAAGAPAAPDRGYDPIKEYSGGTSGTVAPAGPTQNRFEHAPGKGPLK